jgi:virginiamycin B lyase
MRKSRRIVGVFAALMIGTVSTSYAALLPGLGEVSGSVDAPKGALIPVYLHNKELNVAYGVFAVDGKYRAVNVFPGRYAITVQDNYVPSKDTYEMAPVSVDVTAGGHAKADLAPKLVAPKLNYTGRNAFPKGVLVQTYEEIYPPGKGRDVLEHSCMVCHDVTWAPSRTATREGWQAFIDLMIKGPGEGGLFGNQIISGPPVVSEERLPRKDIPVLLDYLEKNFGPNAKIRGVLQDEWPALDPAALAKAQFIDYRIPNGERRRGSHDVHFGEDGLVYVTSGPFIVQIDPATGKKKDFPLPEGNQTHGLTVDGDGTVWSSGSGNFVAHLDPKTGKFDIYQDPETGLHGNTPVFNSKGDIWFSQLIGNKIGVWERATDKVTYYESPVPNARPYGLDIDHQGRVWYAEYFTGAMTRFDPKTETFKRFKALTWPNSLRRGGVDSKDNFWFGVYGYKGKYGKIGRVDAKTEQLTEIDLPIKYGHPYDARPDPADNVWISSMNYLTKYNPQTKKFTIYPLPQRTDQPKIEPTKDGAIWYAPRQAASYGYGGAAVVLYPDKDAITTLKAIPGKGMSNNYIADYRGPFTKVMGVTKYSKRGAKNQVAYADADRTAGRVRAQSKTNPSTNPGPATED